MISGIVSYGAALPSFFLSSQSIADAQKSEDAGKILGVTQKTVPDVDEDSATLGTAAAWQALSRSANPDRTRKKIEGIFVGSESHPYAVKPTGTIIAAALGLQPTLALADLQFACKAGTQSLLVGAAYVESGMAQQVLAIGSDTAQARPGDILEFTAAAGSAAFLIGQEKLLARIIDSTSITTDTPDFWRRPGQSYPEHAGRFTGEPAYFAHVSAATRQLLQKTKLKVSDFQYVVFHTPNGKFPRLAATELGCQPHQLEHSLVVEKVGNTYAAASLIALTSVLDHAQAGEKVLITSYGSGAGADSIALEVTAELPRRRKRWDTLLNEQIEQLKPLSYTEAIKRRHA